VPGCSVPGLEDLRHVIFIHVESVYSPPDSPSIENTSCLVPELHPRLDIGWWHPTP